MKVTVKSLLALILLAAFLSVHAAPRQVSAVLRNSGSGWVALNDADHKPIGISSVSSDSTGITVNFSFTAKTVRFFIVAADETYAVQRALVCGASVGLSHAVIQCSQYGQPGAVNPATLVLPSSNLWVHGVFEDAE